MLKDTLPHYFMKPLLVLNGFIILAGGFLTPLWGNFVTHIGGDVRTAGMAICSFSIVIGFLTWVMAHIEAKVQHEERFLLLSAVLIVFCYLGYFWVNSPTKLYLVQISLGIASAIQTPAIYSLYQRYMPLQRATLHWGIWNGLYNIAIGIAALFSAYLAHRFGFFMVLSTMLGCSIIALLLSLFLVFAIRAFNVSRGTSN